LEPHLIDISELIKYILAHPMSMTNSAEEAYAYNQTS